ncbi:MAG: DUF3006 domain-containing protein [Clostridia bacterium]|nr:DUF3006 domain-containing protein [Clostridia bacterium]
MFYTLDRIENGTIAVLIDDEGKKYDVNISLLHGNQDIGSVYSFDGNNYIYNEKETQARRSSNSEKLRKLMSKAKNRK